MFFVSDQSAAQLPDRPSVRQEALSDISYQIYVENVTTGVRGRSQYFSGC